MNAIPAGNSVDKSGNTTPDALLAELAAQDIQFSLYKHEAVFSVAESANIDAEIPGAATRNLFIRDKRENMFLVTLMAHTKIDLAALSGVIGAGRLSFGSPERLMTYLGVTPGSVTPFSIINDTDKKVTLVLDAEMMKQEIVNYHPLINTMTVGLTPDALLKFLENIGRTAQIVDLTPAHASQQENG